MTNMVEWVTIYMAKDVETLDMAKEYVYHVINNNRAYKYDIDIRLFLKHIDKIVLNLK